jgi:hypothetical protein
MHAAVHYSVETNEPRMLEMCLHETDQQSHAPYILAGAEHVVTVAIWLIYEMPKIVW